jgi:hypothetical protein
MRSEHDLSADNDNRRPIRVIIEEDQGPIIHHPADEMEAAGLIQYAKQNGCDWHYYNAITGEEQPPFD